MQQPNKTIYMDHAATTPVRWEVLEAMLPYLTENWGNPSSSHRVGRVARRGLEDARRHIAGILNAQPGEIIFTSGATESDNLAIYGTICATEKKHIITTAFEHHAVLDVCKRLEEHCGFQVTYLPVDRSGIVNPEDVARAITEETALITIMMVNNEIGTIQPVTEIGKIARAAGVPFHTDAVQALNALPVDVNKLQADMVSISAHKLYGPKGAGLLYLRKGTPFTPQQIGGGQENRHRAGTESVANIAGLAKAMELAELERDAYSARMKPLRDHLLAVLPGIIPGTHITGHPAQRLPNNASFAIEGIEGNDLVNALDLAGIYCSTGSACTAGAVEPSHVLLACGIAPDLARGSLRLTLGHSNTEADIDYVLEVLPGIVEKQRKLSPLYTG